MLAGTVIHDENLVGKHEGWIGRKLNSKLFWTLFSLVILPGIIGAYIYTWKVETALASHKEVQAGQMITKSDLESATSGIEAKLNRIEDKIDKKVDKR
jgi:hypothetical protein